MRPSSALLRSFFSTEGAAVTPSVASVFGPLHGPFVEEVRRRLNSQEFLAKRRTLPLSNGRKAAVLCPLLMRGDEPHVLFTLRTSNLATHAGQVSFAGGHIDEGETAKRAAFREFAEEVGVGLGRIQFDYLGLSHEAIAITGTHVSPVVAACLRPLQDLSLLNPNPQEVAEIFTLPLSHLANPSNHEYEFLSKKAKAIPPHHSNGSPASSSSSSAATAPPHPRAGLWLPVFQGGPARIWGLTAFLMMELLKDVFVPAARAIDYPLMDPRSPPNGGPPDVPNLPHGAAGQR